MFIYSVHAIGNYLRNAIKPKPRHQIDVDADLLDANDRRARERNWCEMQLFRLRLQSVIQAYLSAFIAPIRCLARNVILCSVRNLPIVSVLGKQLAEVRCRQQHRGGVFRAKLMSAVDRLV